MTDAEAEAILNTPGARLKAALEDPGRELIEPYWRHGFYGLADMGAEWPRRYAGEIGAALWEMRPYTIIDLGCNVGAKAPLLTAWGCTSYQGLDRDPYFVGLAVSRFGSGLCKFTLLDIVHGTWPILADDSHRVVSMFYVLQHLPLDAKRKVLLRIGLLGTELFILCDAGIRPGASLQDCAEEFAKAPDAMVIPCPESELEAAFPGGYTCTQPVDRLRFVRPKSKAK